MKKEKRFPVMVAARVTESERVLLEDCAWRNRQTKSQFIRTIILKNLNQIAS